MIERLTYEDIIDIHDTALELYNGLPGINEPGLIAFIAEKPFQGFGDEEYYPGLFLKAAVYMEGFAVHQLFCDGNKRTGYLCAKVFLMLNGYHLQVTDDDLYETTIAVATKDIGLHQLADWLERNSVKEPLSY
ncbi:type II toxin-antitoxin system death-on-curing family toxin [Paenibacillus sp. Y412MC10]|uniref:type II toxin-antitoxin system death-on-curing family toxin n=1 Tax=Geobacillus sp. (strain Y412MC10) TaxID=481743 RepID=UPI00119CA401|nr:type II toxin-antitoxin system death-on-curing family toxin [Paenibacillus sp. Y412MC10]